MLEKKTEHPLGASYDAMEKNRWWEAVRRLQLPNGVLSQSDSLKKEWSRSEEKR